MDISGQGGQELNVLHVFLIVEDGFIKVADAPAQGNVVVEQFAQFGCGLACIGVAPCAEWDEYVVALECHIAVHHCTDSDGSQGFDFDLILFEYILAQVSIAILQTIPDSLGGIGPEAVDKLVLPCVATLSDGFLLLVNQHGLDARRAELDAKYGLAFLYCLFCGHCRFEN